MGKVFWLVVYMYCSDYKPETCGSEVIKPFLNKNSAISYAQQLSNNDVPYHNWSIKSKYVYMATSQNKYEVKTELVEIKP